MLGLIPSDVFFGPQRACVIVWDSGVGVTLRTIAGLLDTTLCLCTGAQMVVVLFCPHCLKPDSGLATATTSIQSPYVRKDCQEAEAVSF